MPIMVDIFGRKELHILLLCNHPTKCVSQLTKIIKNQRGNRFMRALDLQLLILGSVSFSQV